MQERRNSIANALELRLSCIDCDVIVIFALTSAICLLFLIEEDEMGAAICLEKTFHLLDLKKDNAADWNVSGKLCQ